MEDGSEVLEAQRLEARNHLQHGDAKRIPIHPVRASGIWSRDSMRSPEARRRPFAAPYLFEADAHSALLLAQGGSHTACVALRKAKAARITPVWPI
jgi:hypothetical protein